MSLLNPIFLLFVLILLLLYYGLFKNYQWQVLLVASVFFYIYNNPINIIYLLLTTLSTYFAARYLAKNKKKSILVLALLFNFLMLSVFKYSAYIYSLFNLEHGIFSYLSFLYNPETKARLLNIIQPLGISFFIFQSTSYLIDVYRKKYDAEKNFFKFALFVSYFPQIIQGPIGRYDKLAPQLYNKNDLNYDNIKFGMQLMLWGYFKKILIGDRAAILVGTIFADYSSYSGALVFLSTLFYGIQIYCDFSGGIDIIRGVSQMFGIKMSINFRQPFFATSIADFWRRWHITLGTWLKEYLFYPLNFSKPLVKLNKFGRRVFGAKKGKFLSLAISTFIIYFVVGIWHGAGLKYIAFGIWNGGIIIISLLLENSYKKLKKGLKINDKSKSHIIFMIIRTNILVCIGRFFTRADGFRTAISMIKHSVVNFNISALNLSVFKSLGLNGKNWAIFIIAIIILLIVDYMGEKDIDLRVKLEEKSYAMNLATIVISVVFIFAFIIYSSGYVPTEFIYKQF